MSLAVIDKHELANAAKLFRLKLRDARSGILLVLLITVLMVAANAVYVWRGFVSNPESLNSQYFLDYSVLVLILAPLVVTFAFWQEATGRNSIYPQSSISRFLAVQALSLSLVVLALLVVLLLYLLLFTASLLMGIWQPSFILGYSFDLTFLMTGFFAALVYLVMVTTAISFVTFVVRSFKLFALIPIVALPLFYLSYPAYTFVSSYLAGLSWLRDRLQGVVRRFLEPETLVYFIVACLATSLVLLIAGIILRSFIKRDRGAKRDSWMLALAYAPYIVLTLYIGFNLIAGSFNDIAPIAATGVFPQQSETIAIDATQVMEDSPLIVMEGSINRDTYERANNLESGFILEYSTDDGFTNESTFLWNSEDDIVMVPFKGQRIFLDYTAPSYDFTSEALRQLTQPEISLQFESLLTEAETLVVDHTFEGEGKVLFMPIWSMMGRIQSNRDNMRPELHLRAE